MKNAVDKLVEENANKDSNILEQLYLEELGIKIISYVINILRDDICMVPCIPNFSEED